MGLFDKKYCDVCGDKIGLLGNRKLEDGNLCKECAKKLSPWFNERRHSSVDEIKAQLAYREENAERVAQFSATRVIGDNWNVIFDERHRWFTVTRASSPNVNENPDILSYSDITGCRFDIDEDKDELYYDDDEGKSVSYDPPRYEYSYNFNFVITVNNPYFDEMSFRLNGSEVEYTPQPAAKITLFGHSITSDNGADPEDCPEYCKYRDMGQELCDEINRARGINTAPAQTATRSTEVGAAAAAPAESGAWICAGCGAENTGKFCESCGSPRPVREANVCEGCGWRPEAGESAPKFCPECGKPFAR